MITFLLCKPFPSSSESELLNFFNMKTGRYLRDPQFLCFVLTQTSKVQSCDENSLFQRIGNIVWSLSSKKTNRAVEKPEKQY